MMGPLVRAERPLGVANHPLGSSAVSAGALRIRVIPVKGLRQAPTPRGGHAMNGHEASPERREEDLQDARREDQPQDWFEAMRSWWDQREHREADRTP